MSRWLRKITPTSVGAVDQVGAFLWGGLPVFEIRQAAPDLKGEMFPARLR
jgi:hypothetical protein